MAWLPINQALVTHRKTLAAADLLDIKPVYLVGHLVAFWLWSLDNVPNGDLNGSSPRIIAYAAQWDGDAKQFVSALEQVGFLDRSEAGLLIHDWQEYAGRLIDRRQAAAERMRRVRNTKEEVPQDVQPACDERAANVLRTCAPTVHNSTVQNNTDVEPANAAPQAPAQKNERERTLTPSQAVFGSLCRGLGLDPRKLTSPERKEVNAATKALVEAHYGPRDVETMTANWVPHFDDCTMTASAIARHATRLMKPPQRSDRGPTYLDADAVLEEVCR